MHLEKNRTYACTFPVQRKEINVVKVRFTVRYSSRKLRNEKVITSACNFWRQISCSFQVMSGNIWFLGKKIFEIPPVFQTRPGDLGEKVHAYSLHFSALNRGSALLKVQGVKPPGAKQIWGFHTCWNWFSWAESNTNKRRTCFWMLGPYIFVYNNNVYYLQ